ncbi:OmpA family protein [Halomonas sp. HK25]|uniref:OmpA family protein n=1 Tax=Halomonas sp. HK25 TaxID=3394321 RepID=UPI0039FC91F8
MSSLLLLRANGLEVAMRHVRVYTRVDVIEQEPRETEVVVVDHTDNQGGFDYNIELSQRRAAAVVEALAAEYGVARDRLKHWGVGFTAPAASNATDEGRARNRRVELVLQ